MARRNGTFEIYEWTRMGAEWYIHGCCHISFVVIRLAEFVLVDHRPWKPWVYWSLSCPHTMDAFSICFFLILRWLVPSFSLNLIPGALHIGSECTWRILNQIILEIKAEAHPTQRSLRLDASCRPPLPLER